jgi:hypothetical protein
MLSRLPVTMLLALTVIAGCSTTAASLAPSETATSPVASHLPASPSSDSFPAQSSSTVPSEPSPGSEAIEAARRLVRADAAHVAMDVRRQKRESDPVETLITLDGRVEPALGRGRARADFSGLFAIPGSSPAPGSESVIELTWTPDELFARSAAQPDGNWTARSRADARATGGLIGRLPDEIDGLAKLVADGDADAFVPAADGSIDGRVARRWILRVPVEHAAVEGVPFDVPNAAVLRDTYGIDEIKIESWLVDRVLRRLRYAVAREHAAYGGPDRTTVTYDWTPTTDAEPIVVPTAGA